MYKDFSSLTRLFMRIYWLPATIWIAVQILVISYYRILTLVYSIAEPIPATPSNTVIFSMAGVLALSYMVLLIFMGNLFSSSQRASWLRQLPFRASSLNLFPLFVTLLYGLCLLIFIPWGSFSSGVSVFTIGIPVSVFLVLKNARNYVIGLCKAASTGVVLIFIWLYLFYDWSAHQPQLVVEIAALLLFCTIWQTLARKERIYTLPIATILIGLLTSSSLYRQFRTPDTFIDATLDHAFFSTEKTLVRFKKIALKRSYWESVEQFDLPSFVRFKSQDFVNSFSDDEKIQFIENIEFNRMRWKDIKLPANRPMRFASFLQPEIRFRNYSGFPIGKFNVTPKIESYLYAHWKNSPLFCQLLPFRKTGEYLNKMFNYEDCSLFNQATWSFYSFFERGEYETLFDKYLLESFEKAPSKTKSNLMLFLSGGWGLSETKDKYDGLRHVIFNQKPLLEDLLVQMKTDRYRLSLGKLKKLPHDQEGFYREVDHFSVNDNDSKVPILFLCQYLFDDCNEYLNKRKSEALSLPNAWFLRIHSLSFDDEGIWIFWIKQEVSKSENWLKIAKLLKYTEDRTDL